MGPDVIWYYLYRTNNFDDYAQSGGVDRRPEFTNRPVLVEIHGTAAGTARGTN